MISQSNPHPLKHHSPAGRRGAGLKAFPSAEEVELSNESFLKARLRIRPDISWFSVRFLRIKSPATAGLGAPGIREAVRVRIPPSRPPFVPRPSPPG